MSDKLIAIFATEWLAHWCSDWALQNSFIANRKRQSWAVAALHACIYCIPFLLFYLWNPWNPIDRLDLIKLAFIGVSHMVIDRLNFGALWVRIYNNDWKDWTIEKPTAPLFVAISLDQFQHHCINIVVLSWGCNWGELFQLLN